MIRARKFKQIATRYPWKRLSVCIRKNYSSIKIVVDKNKLAHGELQPYTKGRSL